VKAGPSPTGRALRALELLQAQPGITAAQLAAQLGVTDRAARRYVAILREADIPIESTPGPYGGYRLGRGIRLPPLVFTAAEALGLVMAVLDGSHAAADADDPVGAALGKIIRALPENVSRPAATMRRHALAAPDRAAVRPGTKTTSALVAAVAAQRRVSIGYRSESGKQWAEDVDPWAVVVRHGRWYLLCHSHRASAVRAYRIDRIQSAAAGSGQFRPPGDLNYADLLEQHLGTGWEFQTKVIFDAPCDQVARYVRPPMGRLERTGDSERCVLTGTTSNPAMYAGEWLAAIPIRFHVEGGPELRAAVAAVTERLTAALAAPPDNDRLPRTRPRTGKHARRVFHITQRDRHSGRHPRNSRRQARRLASDGAAHGDGRTVRSARGWGKQATAYSLALSRWPGGYAVPCLGHGRPSMAG
jgi:predicted DNA-binding transcriptional regulator YafY